MRIAVPKEIMNNENRVALTPSGAQTLVQDGHEVLIETGAGEGASFPDSEYEAAGASIVGTAEDTWAQAELLLKVKEPLEAEYQYLRPDLTVFTYLHLAADRPLTEALVDANTTAIAYETVTDRHGTISEATLIEPLGLLARGDGSIVTLRDVAPRSVRPAAEHAALLAAEIHTVTVGARHQP